MNAKQVWHIVCACAIVGLIAGCGGNKKEAFVTYDVAALLAQPEDIPLSGITHDIRKIQLETNDSILISRIKKMFDTGDRLVIIQNNRCMVFDKNGKYLNDISRKGGGPNEFVSIWDAFMEGNTICLIDRQVNKLRFFELDGTPVKEITTPRQIGSAALAGNGLYAGYIENLNGKRSNKLIYFDQNGMQQDSVSCAEDYVNKGMFSLFFFEGMFFSSGSHKYVKELFNDTIYTMLPDHTIHPRMLLDMGSYNATMEKRHNLEDPNKDFFAEMAQVRIVGESENYLFFTAMMDKKTYVFYLDKKNNRIHQARFTDAIGFGEDTYFIPRCISEDNKRILTYIDDEDGEDNPAIIIATIN